MARSARPGESSRPRLRSSGRKRATRSGPRRLFRTRYTRRLLQDSAGFGAAEIFRRTIGLAHVQDFWTITDEQTRAAAESLALDVARSWLAQSASFTTIDDLAEIVARAG